MRADRSLFPYKGGRVDHHAITCEVSASMSVQPGLALSGGVQSPFLPTGQWTDSGYARRVDDAERSPRGAV